MPATIGIVTVRKENIDQRNDRDQAAAQRGHEVSADEAGDQRGNDPDESVAFAEWAPFAQLSNQEEYKLQDNGQREEGGTTSAKRQRGPHQRYSATALRLAREESSGK